MSKPPSRDVEKSPVPTISGGYVLLARRYLKSRLWALGPNVAHFAVYCLLRANWKPAYFNTGGQVTEIKRGQFFASLDTMSRESGLSERSVRTCLEKLEKIEFATREATRKGYLITVCNYATYQNPRLYSDTRSDTHPTRKRHVRDTRATPIEERKEDQEGIEREEGGEWPPLHPPTSDDARRVFQELAERWNGIDFDFVLPLRSTDPNHPVNEERVQQIAAKKNGWLGLASEAVERIASGECGFFSINPRNWRPTFDVLLDPSKLAKIVEGAYDSPCED